MSDGALVGSQETTGQAVDLQQMQGAAMAEAEEAAKPQSGPDSFEIESTGGDAAPAKDTSDTAVLMEAGTARFTQRAAFLLGAAAVLKDSGGDLFSKSKGNTSKKSGAKQSIFIKPGYREKLAKMKQDRKEVAKTYRKHGRQAALKLRKKQVAADGVVGGVALASQSVKAVSGAKIPGNATAALAKVAAIQRRIDQGVSATVHHEAKKMTATQSQSVRNGNDTVIDRMNDNPGNMNVNVVGANRQMQQGINAPKPPSPPTSQ